VAGQLVETLESDPLGVWGVLVEEQPSEQARADGHRFGRLVVRPAEQRDARGSGELVIHVIAHAEGEVDMPWLEPAELSRQRFDRCRVLGAGHAHDLGLAFVAAEYRVGQIQEDASRPDRARIPLVLAPAPGHRGVG
jgi:hypothetical protein